FRDNRVNGLFSELYAYDTLNQLASAQRGALDAGRTSIPNPTWAGSWGPDAVGNFQWVWNSADGLVNRTHNKQNQLTGVGSSTLAYDKNGDLTTDETGRTFTSDAWNRLVSVNGTARYAYDPLGRRTKEGSTDLYYHADWQLVEERNSSNQPVARYV